MKFKKLVKHIRSHRKCLLAVLVDPDKYNEELIRVAEHKNVSCFLVGGSKLERGDVTKTVQAIKKISSLPVILFPGDETQLSEDADGLLLLSLLSGRNPDYLIGKHVKAAPLIKKMKLKSLSTAYLLIGGGKKSTTEEVTKTKPLDSKKQTEIVNTALAAEQLGFQAIYLEAGSGAKTTVASTLIKKIKNEIALPIIVGGGIDSLTKAKTLVEAGADMIVIGNGLEKNVYLLTEVSMIFK